MGGLMSTLFVINDAPYGDERPYNALRLALNLAKRSGTAVRVFLTGDGALRTRWPGNA